MSKFKLDFDISSHRRLAPRKTCTSTSTVVAPEDRSANQVSPERKAKPPAETAKAKKDPKPADASTKLPAQAASIVSISSLPSRTKLFFAVVVAFATFTYLFLNLNVPLAQQSRKVTISRCTTRNSAVTCQSACGLRGNCRTPQIVSFATKQCADGVHTVHLHGDGTGPRRVPAFYLRVPNTTMFEFSGDRGIFRPASCQAEMRNVVLRSAPMPAKWTMSGYLWWVSGDFADSFDIVRGSKVIAELDASVVLQRCYSSTHCVFKLPMECGVARQAHVFYKTPAGQERAETFVFC